jgi:hypothetical protein
MRTHGSEGATEPGRGGPWPIGPGRPAWPTPDVCSAPLPCTRRIFNPKALEAPPFAKGESHSHQEAIHKLETERREISGGGLTTSKEAPMLPWIHSIRRVHHRSSHEYLRLVTVRGEGKGETVVTTPDRLDWFSCLKRLMF